MHYDSGTWSPGALCAQSLDVRGERPRFGVHIRRGYRQDENTMHGEQPLPSLGALVVDWAEVKRHGVDLDGNTDVGPVGVRRPDELSIRREKVDVPLG